MLKRPQGAMAHVTVFTECKTCRYVLSLLLVHFADDGSVIGRRCQCRGPGGFPTSSTTWPTCRTRP